MNNIKDDYLVSVIIPSFNEREKLKKCIDSIINQTIGFENIELIIVDDASTDAQIKKIIQNYQLQYPHNIKPIFLEENAGYPGKPRNIGMKYVTSDYILFADDDDEYLKNGFETLYTAINKYDSDLIIGNSYTNINGKNFSNIKNLKENIININPLKNQKNFDILVDKMCPWAKIHKKEFLEKNNIKFLEGYYCEDYYFFLDILRHSKKITILPNEIVYKYNKNKDSIIHKINIELFNNIIKVVYIITNPLKDVNIDLNLIFNNHIIFILIIFTHLTQKQKEENILKIYKLEKYLEKEYNFKMDLKRKEMDILNYFIMKKKFKKAILISNIYERLHNNQFIQQLFYKLHLG